MQEKNQRQLVLEALEKLNSLNLKQPKVGIVLGSGLAHLANEIQNSQIVSYEDIPNFPKSTVESHAGKLIFGELGNKTVVAMQGRFHVYEGYSGEQITFGIRVMKELGIDLLIVSNACGGLNPKFKAGELVLVSDYINLLGLNPLIGPNDDSWGPRFVDMKDCYSQELRALAHEVAKENAIKLEDGVYVAVAGPNLETRAEYRMLSKMGADMVGMSTIPETIVARHMGIDVIAFSVVTDMCLPDNLHVATFDEILKVANGTEPHLTKLILNLLKRI